MPLAKTPKLTKPQKRALQAVLESFRANGRWPALRQLRIQFRHDFDFIEVVRSMSPDLIVADDINQADAGCRLGYGGLLKCDGAGDLVADIVAYLRHLGELYVSGGSGKATDAAIGEALKMDAERLRRVAIFTQYATI